ncbi:MAG: hypothetical protein KDM91_11560 [Verrucomicrobiae bacterium]|nr:hypothetical protein [Verrucomicrobiae bacterium]
MSDEIRRMIRTQLARRNSANDWVRREARALIRAHIGWLRNLRDSRAA